MFRIRVAELFIDIHPVHALIEECCKDYIVSREEGIPADIEIFTTDQELQREITACPYPIDAEEAELVCVSMALGKELPRFGAVFLHAATFLIDGKAYALSAASGTGKTTLLRFCKELLGRRVGLINGDKTIIRYQNGQMIAYGSPWCGKEHWGENASLALTGIILLSRGEKNRIKEADPMQCLAVLMQQIYIPEEGCAYQEKLLEILDHLLAQAKVYQMTCRKNPEAARVLFKGIGIDLGE